MQKNCVGFEEKVLQLNNNAFLQEFEDKIKLEKI